VRVLQNGHVLARLTAVRKQNDRFTAIWQGAPPPFQPFEQIEPLVVESDDGLERSEGWLLSVLRPASGGRSFRVEIGSERNAPAWRRSSPAPEQRETAQKRNILVVDDDRETVSLVAEVLESEGFAVQRANGGREALALAAELVPDVAVVDLIMPEMGGEEVCAALRRDPKYASTRVLVLSGAEDTRMVAAACDADSAVTKPFTTELLVREVRRLTGQ
jgi:CheY-like chemotaxis protein